MNSDPEADETQALAVVTSAEVVTEISAETINAIEAKLALAVSSAEEAREMIRAAVGPNPGKIPADMLTQIQQGTGYFRVPRDTIRRMFREFNLLRKQAACDHGGGRKYEGHYAFCARCRAKFVHHEAHGWVLESTQTGGGQ